MGHVALYCRISSDKKLNRGEGVDIQRRWGQDYAASAWPGLPIEVYSDNDISAASGAHRPGYEALRSAIRAGEVERIWCVEQSRLERREAGWFELAAELDGAGIAEVHTNRDGVVAVGSELAGIKAVLNAGESKRVKKRVNDMLDERAAEGRPGGGRRYGYRRGLNDKNEKTLEIEPNEAAFIREAAELVLSGWSLARIAKHLGAKGAVGARGGQLRPTAVRSMLTSPTTAGKRQHRGRIVGDAAWPPILDELTWHAVRARLDAPHTVTRSDGSIYEVSGKHWQGRRGRRYLLTGGLVRCGVCEAPLVGQLKALKSAKVPYLACHPNRGGKACVGIRMEPVDEKVTDELWAQLDRADFLAAVIGDDQTERRKAIGLELERQERKRSELAELWANDTLTAIEWQTARRATAEREQELQAELAAIPNQQLDADQLRSARGAWPLMTLEEQQAFIRIFVDAVIVHRAQRAGNKVDPGRIEIRWATAGSQPCPD